MIWPNSRGIFWEVTFSNSGVLLGVEIFHIASHGARKGWIGIT